MKIKALLLAAFAALVWAGALHATPSAVQFNVTNSTVSSSTITVTLTGTTAGNTIFVDGMVNAAQLFSGVPTDTQGNTYVAATGSPATNSNVITGHWVAKNIIGGAGVNTITLHTNFANNQNVLTAVEVGGVNTNPLDGSNMAQANTGTSLSTSATNSVQPAIEIAYAWCGNGALTAGSGFTQITNFNPSGAGGAALLEYKLLATTGSQTAAATCGATGPWVIGMGIFDAAPSITHRGLTSAGALAIPNGTSGSYLGKTGGFVTPDGSTVQFFRVDLGDFGVN